MRSFNFSCFQLRIDELRIKDISSLYPDTGRVDKEGKERIIPDMSEGINLGPDLSVGNTFELDPTAEAVETVAAPEAAGPEVCHARFRVVCTQPDTNPARGRAVLRCWDDRCGVMNKGLRVGMDRHVILTQEQIVGELKESAREGVLIYKCGAWEANEQRRFDEPIPDQFLPPVLRRV